eukprot:TRINITY_DN67502_c0_g1_i1.p1 TRINITY_DN67502_c0_g1~~TRINITY_DN67502_c0_g1_i1.p1  ORF type:complete len:1108 (-),score=217.57 TRINITY_DN67502_c0_g1_i1:52-3297(-)
MASAVDELSQELSARESRQVFEVLLPLLQGIVDRPSDSGRRSISEEVVQAWPSQSRKLLTALGFQKTGGAFVCGSDASLDALSEAALIMECVVASMEDDPEEATKRVRADDPESKMDVDDDDLAAALKLSMQGEGAAQEQPELDRQESRVDVEFERFNADEVLIDENAVSQINAYCQETGEQYVDPQFAPNNRSLYMDPLDAERWKCASCGEGNPLPPVPDTPATREEAEKLQAWLEAIACTKCKTQASRVNRVAIMNRPMSWLRPGAKCQGCAMIYSMSPAGAELATRMCTHYLRDQVTHTTIGSPWKLIREAARPEDVCQGGIGNCWFAGALSVVAQVPQLIQRLFLTKEYNPNGAYHMQLFHAGAWKPILVDDLFPCSKIFQGYMDGQTVYYSRGGTLSYTSCARHQLWVPLVEKASAKLFGSYGALVSGTMAEALTLFTGCPVERIQLYVPKDVKRRRAERRDAKIAYRTQLLLQGKQPEDDNDEDEEMENDETGDLLWSRLLSFKEAGYLMGMACAGEAIEKTREQVNGMGLQTPHAYGVLDVREVQVDGKVERLMQIRNPIGENAPFTWKGDWGKDSPKWTFPLKLELGVVNKSNVPMYEQSGIFWMRFSDMMEYFAELDVCRVHTKGWHEQRVRGWLPSGVGPGQSFDFTVFEKTQVDLALWQEKHITRESALGGKSTNVDIGFAVLRKRGANADGTIEYECIKYVKRSRQDLASGEMILDGGYCYKIVPLCFNQMDHAPRQAYLTIHSSKRTKLEVAPTTTWRDLAVAMLEGAKKAGRRSSQEQHPGVSTYMLQDYEGFCYAVENHSSTPFGLQIDCSDSTGCVSAKSGLFAVECVPPQSRQVVMILTFAQGATRCGYSFGYSPLPPGAMSMAVPTEDVHMALPITPLTRGLGGAPIPDPAILSQAVPEPLTPCSADAADLAEALKLSVQGDASMEDDEDLAAAIALSMGGAGAEEASAPAAPPAAAIAARPPSASGDSSGAKERLQARVKELFTQYSQQGMSPTDAAARAMQEAQREASTGAAGRRAEASGDAKAKLQGIVKDLYSKYVQQGMAPNDAAAKAMEDAKKQLGS